MKEQYYAMIIAPHPDDSEFAIAGTVAKWTKQGKKVIYVICTNGNKGTDDPEMTPAKLAEIRRQEETGGWLKHWVYRRLYSWNMTTNRWKIPLNFARSSSRLSVPTGLK